MKPKNKNSQRSSRPQFILKTDEKKGSEYL